MIMVHRHHIRAEKEWKTALKINMLVKMINVMTGRTPNRTNSYFLQLVIHILNLLTKLSLFPCFSFYCFTVLWKHFKSEFTHLKVVYRNCKLFYITKFTSVHPLFWLIQAIQQSCHSTTSPWWWLLHQSKHWRNLNKLG